MEACWRIELFGGVRAVRGDTVVEHFRTQKTAALLGLLAYPPGRARSRDELIEAFWPDDDLNSARHKLSVALHSLRQQLEPDGVPEGSVLVAERFSVRLAPQAVTTDAGDFEETVSSATRALSDGDRAVRLARAVSLYRGELLAGLYDSWIFPEQQRLAERFVDALRRLVALYEAAGDHRSAMQAALQAVTADPLPLASWPAPPALKRIQQPIDPQSAIRKSGGAGTSYSQSAIRDPRSAIPAEPPGGAVPLAVLRRARDGPPVPRGCCPAGQHRAGQGSAPGRQD